MDDMSALPGVAADAGAPDGPQVRGRVKWFDPQKGFGFIVPDAGGPDILLHANVLRAFGQGSVGDGAEIEVIVHETRRGLQASAVIDIVVPAMVPVSDMDELGGLSPEAVADLALEPARVKWFDRARGFGFANVFGREDDVFLHIEVLRRSGFSEVQPGEALCLRIIEGRRGRMAVLVAPWEAALKREPA